VREKKKAEKRKEKEPLGLEIFSACHNQEKKRVEEKEEIATLFTPRPDRGKRRRGKVGGGERRKREGILLGHRLFHAPAWWSGEKRGKKKEGSGRGEKGEGLHARPPFQRMAGRGKKRRGEKVGIVSSAIKLH